MIGSVRVGLAGTPSLPGLALAALGTLLLTAAIVPLPDPALLPVLAVAMLLGAAFVLSGYGFTAGYRDLLVRGDGGPMAASLVVPAIAALVVIPVATIGGAHDRFVAPIGLSLVGGAAMFGVGMQLANGCGSGTLVAAGQGSRRMWVTLPFFCLGGVLGSLMLPAALRLPGFGSVDLAGLLGPWGGVLAVEAMLAVASASLLRGRRPPPGRVLAGCVIGALAALLFLVSGEPWGITLGLTLWGAKAVQVAGIDLTAAEFWSADWTTTMLQQPVFALHGSLSDAGMMMGALLAASATGRLHHGAPIGVRAALGAAIGGLLMGVGARLSFGCNVGAFLGGVSSGSLHGFVWAVAALPGCWLGIRARPWFGMPR